LGQNGTEKTSALKTSGPVRLLSRGDKKATKQGHRLDISGQNPENLRRKPPALTLKYRLLSYILSFFASPPRFSQGPSPNPGKFDRSTN
jgi:hypothetical protein